MTQVGIVNTSRSANRVLTALVILAIAIVAIWAVAGGLDQILTGSSEPVVVSE